MTRMTRERPDLVIPSEPKASRGIYWNVIVAGPERQLRELL
jgi:hypothetical protein